jgi:Protein of unknown function (DUF2723)
VTRAAAAVGAALVAFALYHATLLPGVDFGDTGSFQATVGTRLLSPRDAYPLYFAIGGAFVRLTHLEPARALNLASAIEGGAAAGLAVLVAEALTGSVLAGIAAAVLFATSYTFWSQAIIAEVYALHAVFVAGSLLLLLRWSNRPTTGRLAAFFAVYALGFGNHLSMVLLLPGFALFLLLGAPGGWRSMFAPRVVALAAACALAGALQYAWNVRTLWFTAHPPRGLGEALVRFWFDVTKSDWRDTMILRVPESTLGDRAAMYWFDVTQQFTAFGPLLAVGGAFALWFVDRRRAVLLALLYAVNAGFAFSYNVGDTHVFYLPSHFIVSLLIVASVLASPREFRGWLAAAMVALAAAKAYRDFPALDRSSDTRPAQVLEQLTSGIDEARSILLTDLNWQIANGLSYFAKVTEPGIVHARMPDVLLYAPALIADNGAIGRQTIVTDRARQELQAAYGPYVRTSLDRITAPLPLTAELSAVPRGTRYALAILRPSRDQSLNRTDIGAAVRALTGAEIALPTQDYVAFAGVAGEMPLFTAASDAPFRRRTTIAGASVDLRMESWLSVDTIRRMGFGHVIVNRRHTLIIERGVSFVAFDADGAPIHVAYRSNIFAPQPRFLCYR